MGVKSSLRNILMEGAETYTILHKFTTYPTLISVKGSSISRYGLFSMTASIATAVGTYIVLATIWRAVGSHQIHLMVMHITPPLDANTRLSHGDVGRPIQGAHWDTYWRSTMWPVLGMSSSSQRRN